MLAATRLIGAFVGHHRPAKVLAPASSLAAEAPGLRSRALRLAGRDALANASGNAA